MVASARQTVEYRVEVTPWSGDGTAASALEDRLNEMAADGWRIVAVLPTTAATSIRSLVNARASADTTEFAVVLERPVAPKRSR